eukprot:g312.t1
MESAADDVTQQDDSFHCFTGHSSTHRTSRKQRTVIQHFYSDSVFCVAWSPVGDLSVASGGQDDIVYLWKTCSPDSEMEELPCEALEGHTDSVIDIGFNHNGELLASGAMDGLVKIWSKDGALMRTLEGPNEAITWICWHSRGDVILAGSADFSSWMWNTQTGTCMQVFSGHGSSVSCGKFSSDGRQIFTCGEDDDPSLKIWNPRTGSCIMTITGHNFHQAGNSVFSCSLLHQCCPLGINCLEVNAESTMSLTGSSDCSAKLSNLATGHPVGTLSAHSESIECAGFIEGVFPVLVTGSLDGKVIIWDRQSLNQRHFYHHPAGVISIKALTQSPVLVTGCLDGIVRLLDARSCDFIKEFKGSEDSIQCLAVSPNEHMILTGSDDATVRIFDIRQNMPLQ